MAEIEIRITGMEDLFRKLDRIPQVARLGAARVLYEEAEKIMTNSKENYVPVDTGTLRDTGTVEQPEIDEAGIVSVTMGYGGPSAPYALYVHEIPAPPEQSAGGRSAEHTVGQWKYLEIPTLEAVPGLPDAFIEGLRPLIEGIGSGRE
jgi:hypothetical protein